MVETAKLDDLDGIELWTRVKDVSWEECSPAGVFQGHRNVGGTIQGLHLVP